MARNPVTFSNGTLVQKAQVEIDGNIYEVEPAQYDGTTPLSASNLNLLQTRLYDYVDNEITNLNTVQTFTETLTDSNNTGIQITVLWKKVGKIVSLMINAYLPSGKGGLITVNRYPFTIPEWAKPTSTSNFFDYKGTTNKFVGRFFEKTTGNNNSEITVAADLITNETRGLVLYGSCYNGDSSNNHYVNGTMTYILD